jgi:hypothetical protein
MTTNNSPPASAIQPESSLSHVFRASPIIASTCLKGAGGQKRREQDGRDDGQRGENLATRRFSVRFVVVAIIDLSFDAGGR